MLMARARRSGRPRSRREIVLGLAALAAAPLFAARILPIKTARVPWAGADGRILHGYMAIPGKARGPQPAVLVVGDATALPPVVDPVARAVVDQIAAAGLLACTADNVANLADLRASLAWLRSHPYATGRVALVGIGGGAAIAARVAMAEGDRLAALLLVGDDAPHPPNIPALALPWQADGATLPAAAIAFLKEHLA